MAHTFDVPFRGEVREVISRARLAIQKAEGTFNGDEAGGEFKVPAKIGNVEGEYKVDGQNFVVTINRKPIIAPYSLIEDALRKYLS